MSPTEAMGPPSAGSHVHVASTTRPRARTARAAANASAIAKMDTSPAVRPARRSGATTASRTNARNGSARTASGKPTLGPIGLATEQVEAVRLDGPANAEDRDDDGQPDGDLGDRDGDREEREDQTGDVTAEARERDQVDVDRVEHQLDAEQDADRVPARQHAEQADGEDQGGQREVRREADHSSLRAKYSAPSSATASSTPRSSSVIAKGPKRARPIAAVTSALCAGRATSSRARIRKPAMPTKTAAETIAPFTR